MWGNFSCLRKQHDARDWASNHRPSDLKPNALTTAPPRPHSERLGREQKWEEGFALAPIPSRQKRKKMKTF